MIERKSITIAKLIGSPIDSNLKVPIVLSEICNEDTAEPGELVRTLTPDDGNGVDTIYIADGNGTITEKLVVLGAPSTLTFAHLQSKLEYVLVSEIMDSPDQSALGRRKASISRAMDKQEVKRCLDACLAVASQEVTDATGDDIYDVIKKLVRKVEDYGTDYVLLAGTTAYASINDYDKDNADNFHYNVKIKEMIREQGIKLIKIVGNIKLDSGADAPILAVDKMILVARNSQLAQGRPIEFIRRKISSAIAQGAGAEVDVNERALYVADTPSPLYNGTTLTHGFGIFGYESIIQAILNFRAISWVVMS